MSTHPKSSFNKSYAVTYSDMYTLRFANCNPLSHVTMDVRTEFYNIHNGSTKYYLSAEQMGIPSLFFSFSIIYLCFLAFWISICFKNHQYFHWIHLLMGVLLVMKGLNLLCAAKVQHSIKVTGTPPHGWSVLLYILQFISTVFLYTLMAMIYDECSFLKPDFLVKSGLMIVIPLQVFATIASKLEMLVLFEESWGWGFGLFIADNVCNILLMVLMAIATRKTDQTVKNYLAMLSLINLFHTMFIVYSCVAFALGLGINLDYNYGWAMAGEIASLVVYIVMFFCFRPFEKNKYFFQLNHRLPVAPECEL